MYDRRTFVRGIGAMTVAGVLAGCSGGGGSEAPTSGGTTTGGAGTPTGGSEATTGSSQTTTGSSQTTTASKGGGGSAPSAVSSWLSDTDNFDGSVADMTGKSEATVKVGAKGNGGNFAFAPAAIRIDSGTKVTWKWTGDGGQHTVTAESGGDFDSGLMSDAGATFSQTFDSTGVVTYYCTPHRSLGMKGAVVVE